MEFVRDYNKTAIIYEGRNISYKEMITKAKIFSSQVLIEKEDRVIIYMENRPELLYSFLGVWDKSGTCVCLDSSLSGEELVYYIEDSDSKYIYTSQNNLSNVKKALEAAKKDLKIVVVDGVEDHEITEELVLNSPEPENIALMLYTSGTTGKPKGVMLKFDNILVNIEGLDKYKMFVKEDIVLALLPMHHIFPLLGSGVVPLAKGATIIFLKEMSSQAMVDAFQTYKVTMMIGVPRLWEMLHQKIMEKINAGKATKLIFKLCEKINSISFSRKIFKKVHDNFGGNVRFFVSGGSKLDPRVSRDFLTLGLKVCEGYGMTETAPMISFTPLDEIRPGSAGRILPGIEAKIAEDGEIIARGRNVMKGYYNKPEETAETIDSEGWIHTGDLGEIRDGFLYVTGRKKEMIVLSNGKNINPIEIEQQIMSKTNLIQEIVISEIDSVLTAVIYPNFQKIYDEKVTNIKETLKWGVIDSYNGKAPNYRKILDIRIVQEEMPKTKIGKIRRFMIPDMLKEKETENIHIEEPKYEEYTLLKDYLVKTKNRPVSPSAHIELDLGMDSLDMVELLTYLESNFGVKGAENIILDNPTVEKLAEFVKENRSDEKIEEINWKDYLNKDIEADLPKSNIVTMMGKLLTWLPFKLYFRVQKSGMENLTSEPVIYAGNHQSLLDAFIFNHSVPSKILRNIYYLAKVKHFSKGYMRKLGENSNVILVDINKNLGEVLQTMAKVLKDGKSVVIFPEGARTRDGKMLEFKKAFAILAKELDIPVVPFGIRGAFEAFPANTKFPKASKIEVKFFEKVSPEGLNYDEIVEKTRESLVKWVEDKI
ncbi:AMP-binding protein [Fusobacterium ulcerans]|uniref:AMP-binding protein n=1 Tax=Fusobacterium ulcerans TaxID=861 RepID=UPI002E7600E8|nr:AMP-binding protein [Fusobacterium ulcerans]MEE0137755.1 AMP-binding protein [Fusobacterium ulcerans]